MKADCDGVLKLMSMPIHFFYNGSIHRLFDEKVYLCIYNPGYYNLNYK